jgi:hypothetical protein
VSEVDYRVEAAQADILGFLAGMIQITDLMFSNFWKLIPVYKRKARNQAKNVVKAISPAQGFLTGG